MRWIAAGFLPLAALLAAVAPSLVSCGAGGLPSSVDRSFTSTVTLSNENLVWVESALSLKVNGSVLGSDMHVSLQATVSASTATRARQLAQTIQLVVERMPDNREVHVYLNGPPPFEADIQGIMTVDMPDRLALIAMAHGGTLEVSSVHGKIQAQSARDAKIADASEQVDLEVSAGNALVDSSLPPGSATTIADHGGSVAVSMPPTVSANITAQIVGEGGQVLVTHPGLPPAVGPGTTQYHQIVNGGLAQLNVVTTAGNVVLQSR